MKRLLLIAVISIGFNAMSQLPSSGRTVYFNFNGNLNDESGNGLNASKSGAISYALTENSTSTDSSVILNGVDSEVFLNYTGNESNIETQNYTCIAKLKLDTINLYSNIFELGNSAVASVYFRLLRVSSTKARIQVGNYDETAINGTNFEYDINGSIDLFEAHTYAVKSSYNSTTQIRAFELFIDGSLVKQGEFTENGLINFDNIETRMSIGHRYNATGMKIKGQMDYFMYYNVALDSEFLSTEPLSTVVLEKNTINVYPNPTNGLVTISTEHAGSTIQVMDASGRILKTEKMLTEQTTVDLSLHENGVYFLNVIDANGNSSSKKLIVRK